MCEDRPKGNFIPIPPRAEVILSFNALQIEHLKKILEGQLAMAGFCEMADNDPGEQEKYKICEEILEKINHLWYINPGSG